MLLKELQAIFLLSGVKLLGQTATPNQYGSHGSWWICDTDIGTILTGWRRRVILIDWESTPHRHIVTEDDVTKGPTHVHAHSMPMAAQYIKNLGALVRREQALAARAAEDAVRSASVAGNVERSAMSS